MSKLSSLFLGVLSGAAMFGAIQYASGNDLRGALAMRNGSDAVAAALPGPVDSVNRAAKTDRAALASARAATPGQTIAFQVQGLADTSVLLRLAGTPVNGGAVVPSATRLQAKPQRATLACEPPVSMLTEVAKLLQPGRCVT